MGKEESASGTVGQTGRAGWLTADHIVGMEGRHGMGGDNSNRTYHFHLTAVERLLLHNAHGRIAQPNAASSVGKEIVVADWLMFAVGGVACLLGIQ